MKIEGVGADTSCPAGGALALLIKPLSVSEKKRGNLLDQSLAVVYPDPQILILLQDVDDLSLQRQIILRLRVKKKKKKKEVEMND